MNGRSDSAEYFNRNRECNPPDDGYTSSEYSSVTQNPWDFTAYTVGFPNHAPVFDTDPTPTPTTSSSTPTPTPTPSPSSGGSAAAWVSNQAYVAGNVVSYGGDKRPPASGITTRSQAVHRAPGTMPFRNPLIFRRAAYWRWVHLLWANDDRHVGIMGHIDQWPD